MVSTTHGMEVKQLILESSRSGSVLSGYDHTMDIGLFSAVVKAHLDQEKETNQNAKSTLKHFKDRPLTLRKEV